MARLLWGEVPAWGRFLGHWFSNFKYITVPGGLVKHRLLGLISASESVVLGWGPRMPISGRVTGQAAAASWGPPTVPEAEMCGGFCGRRIRKNHSRPRGKLWGANQNISEISRRGFPGTESFPGSTTEARQSWVDLEDHSLGNHRGCGQTDGCNSHPGRPGPSPEAVTDREP